MKAIVLLNAAAGGLSGMEEQQRIRSVAEAMQAAGIDADIRVVPHHALESEARAAATAAVDAVIAGGGDGTISTVAGVLAGKAMPLGVLPLGTLNHFAKDLRIPLELPAAAAVIAAMHVAKVDVAEVNGRVFINNASLGMYPRIVLERESERRRRRWRKWTAMILAVFKVFRQFPLARVCLATEKDALVRKTPLVFVGNNFYQFDLFKVGRRDCLDRGELSLYIANAHDRWGMFKLALRVLVGRLDQSRDVDSFRLPAFTIETRRRKLHLAVDGEVIRRSPPLHFRVRPRDLRVFTPAQPVDE